MSHESPVESQEFAMVCMHTMRSGLCAKCIEIAAFLLLLVLGNPQECG